MIRTDKRGEILKYDYSYSSLNRKELEKDGNV
jgi:hypothetical protein